MVNGTQVVNICSLFCPELDAELLLQDDVLQGIRGQFFATGKRQKNKITREFCNIISYYSYLLEQGKSLKWKRMVSGKLLERSCVNADGSYDVLVMDEFANLRKRISFDGQHNWCGLEYYGGLSKPLLVLSFQNGVLVMTRFDEFSAEVTVCELHEFDVRLENYGAEAFSSKFITAVCCTDRGYVTYSTPEQIKAIQELKKREGDGFLMETLPVTAVGQDEETNDRGGITGYSGCTDDQYDECVLSAVGCPYKGNFKKVIKTDKDEKYFYFGEADGLKRQGYGITATSEGVPVYAGDYMADKRDGFGVYYYDTGEVCYMGHFEGNKRCRAGVSLSKDHGLLHVGSWSDDRPVGISSVFDDNGNLIFAGKLDNGVKTGPGFTYDNKTGRLFVAVFENDVYTGNGTLFDEAGRVSYTGGVLEFMKEGLGVEYNPDGSVRYRGNFAEDKYDGAGVLFFDDGSRVEGNFVNGKTQGVAREYDAKGFKLYEGAIVDGKYHGDGVKYLGHGGYIQGDFDGGQVTGVFSQFDADGALVYCGEFVDALYCGKGSLYADGCKLYEGEFKVGKYEGLGSLYFGDECVYKGEFLAGIRHGFGECYCEAVLQYVGYFSADMYSGLGMLYENGVLKFVGSFMNGQKHGRINEICDGAVIRECVFENDDLKYVREFQFPKMNLLYDGNVIAGERGGMGCEFSPFGEKKAEGIFAAGQLVNSMKVCLRKVSELPEEPRLGSFGYAQFRGGPDFVVEKNVMGGVYSGLLVDGRPDGNGTILYADHRYTGEFIDGKANGNGVIYKNDGTEIKGMFLRSYVDGATVIKFCDGVKYNLM